MLREPEKTPWATATEIPTRRLRNTSMMRRPAADGRRSATDGRRVREEKAPLTEVRGRERSSSERIKQRGESRFSSPPEVKN